MSDAVRFFMEDLSDLTLAILIISLVGFAVHMLRVRRRATTGLAARRFAEFCFSLAIFFGWFALVYYDRRFNVWPWHDLVEVMGYAWYWPLRLMLIITLARLWRALRP